MTPGQEALAEAARRESARVYSRTVPERPSTAVPTAGSVVAWPRTDPATGAARLAALLADAGERPIVAVPDARTRTRIEQAIARGHDDQVIRTDLHVTDAQIGWVRDAQERAIA